MAFDIFLIASARTDGGTLATRLDQTLAGTRAAALLIKADGIDENDYLDRIAVLAAIAQPQGCAVLVDNRPDLVERARADGVHMSGGLKPLRDAIADLKPGFIVGTGDIGSRHEAMTRGELDIDYLMFGDRDQDDSDGRDMAQWWAQTFEVPSVWCARSAHDAAIGTVGTEFVAFADADWDGLDRRVPIAGEAP